MSCIHLFALVQLAMTVSGTGHPATASQATTAAGELGKDGSWARYHVRIKDYDGTQSSQKVTISSVGRTTENGRQCRWIEVNQEFIDDLLGSKATYVVKFLIPEEELVAAEKPLLHVVKSWQKSLNGEISRVDQQPIKDLNEKLNIGYGPFMLFFPGPMKNTKKLEDPKTVEYQKGRLECEVGVTGRHTTGYRAMTIDVQLTWTTDYSLWLHKNVPFGFAAATMKTTKRVQDDKGTFLFGTPQTRTAEYSLEDTGTDAKSALPDND